MNLINSQQEKSPQLPDQSKQKFSTLSPNKFPSDQIEDAANNMSIIHVSPNVLLTLMPLQQENLKTTNSLWHLQRQSSVGAI